MLGIWHFLKFNLVDWDYKVQKNKNCRKVGCFCAQSKFQHCCLLCIWQVHVRQQTGTFLLSFVLFRQIL